MIASSQHAYGVELSCEFREVEALWDGDGELVHEALIADGATLRVERGAAGDHLIRCGEHRFHLSADCSRLACPRPTVPDPLWWGAFLDWVPYSAASLSGLLCIHAAGVLIDGRVLAVAADAGAGKSTLAAELLARGATFFCDDVLAVEPTGEGVVAHPGPRLAKVAAARPDLVERLGRPLGRAGEEVLVEVAGAAGPPSPIAAVVILDRSAEGAARPRLVEEGLPALRRLVVGLPGPADRERQRFEALAALVEAAPVVRLRAGAEVPAATLARYLLEALRADGDATGAIESVAAAAPEAGDR
ncbi:MAG TPA: hypothetical protein VJL81_11645 [Solirubrobacterales bacterium]|nr:hypothetical protein [Solirubrobacterales bacterium]